MKMKPFTRAVSKRKRKRWWVDLGHLTVSRPAAPSVSLPDKTVGENEESKAHGLR